MLARKTNLVTVGLALTCLIGLATHACTPKKKTYTVPSVTKEIEDDIRNARALKNKGKLERASKLVLDLTQRVLKEYPQATLTREPVKKLLDTVEWMANMCLDRSMELSKDSITAEQDDLKKKFKQWEDNHRANMSKLRAMIPNLKEAAVAARRAAPMEAGMDAMTPAAGMDAMEPAGGGMEAMDAAMQPAPEDPREPAREPGT